MIGGGEVCAKSASELMMGNRIYAAMEQLSKKTDRMTGDTIQVGKEKIGYNFEGSAEDRDGLYICFGPMPIFARDNYECRNIPSIHPSTYLQVMRDGTSRLSVVGNFNNDPGVYAKIDREGLVSIEGTAGNWSSDIKDALILGVHDLLGVKNKVECGYASDLAFAGPWPLSGLLRKTLSEEYQLPQGSSFWGTAKK